MKSVFVLLLKKLNNKMSFTLHTKILPPTLVHKKFPSQNIKLNGDFLNQIKGQINNCSLVLSQIKGQIK